MIVEFLEDAEQELVEAALWYESKEVGLGVRFRDEIAHGHRKPGYWKSRLQP